MPHTFAWERYAAMISISRYRNIRGDARLYRLAGNGDTTEIREQSKAPTPPNLPIMIRS